MRGSTAACALVLCALAGSAAAQPTAMSSAVVEGPPAAEAATQKRPRPRKVIVEPPAPDPDRAALAQAGEANLVANGPRVGWTLGVALSGWQQVGTFDGTSRALGGIVRFGKPATPDTVVLIELFGLAFPESSSDSFIRSSQSLTALALTYVAPTFWLRYGGGLASVSQAVLDTTKVDTFYNLHQRFGVGITLGAGVDVVQWRSVRLAIENTIAAQRFAQGWIVDLGVGVSIMRY